MQVQGQSKGFPGLSLRDWGRLLWSLGVKSLVMTGGGILLLTLAGLDLRDLVRLAPLLGFVLWSVQILLRAGGRKPLSSDALWAGLGQGILLLFFLGRTVQVVYGLGRGGLSGQGLMIDLILGLLCGLQLGLSDFDSKNALDKGLRWFWGAAGVGLIGLCFL
jgi:hypothetical protein